MTERLIDKLDRLGAVAEIREMTPEIRRFAMLVRQDIVEGWPKREWVGLTDAELVEFSSAELGPYDLCLEVEAKLKEKMTEEDEELNRIEREAKQRTEYETKVYKTGGVVLDGGFYTAADLQQILKAIDYMNTKLKARGA